MLNRKIEMIMTKEQQDLAWACLPKEARDEMKETLYDITVVDDFHKGYKQALYDFFGHHNLTSDTEPEEMLYVERKKVQEVYKNSKEIVSNEVYGSKMYSMHLQIMCVLENLFGDKCLPDKERGCCRTTLNESL